MHWLLERSLRRDFTVIVLAIVVVPLAVTGVWLARSTSRAGEGLLRARLDAALVRAADDILARWTLTRGAILDLADRAEVRRVLERPGSERPTTTRERLPEDIREIVVVDRSGTPRWRTVGSDEPPATAALWVSVPIHDASGAAVGAARAALAPAAFATPVELGVAIGVTARESGLTLVSPPFDAALARGDHFTLGAEPWVARHRVLAEPPVALVAAAPLTDFTAPFVAARRRGLTVLGVVVALALAAAAVVTRRTTRALERLAHTADAIARGELGRAVEVESGEAGRLATALNAMSASLRDTMRELARRESLAAVGEFAASLSHEVRNPLASIRLDLQRVQEKIDPASPLHAPLSRALGEVDRLNATVTGALRVARSGQVSLERIDLLVPLGAAIAAATPELERRGAQLSLELPGPPAIPVEGNGPALEQLFLNLLLNAAQAIAPGGTVAIAVREIDRQVEVAVRDTGVGMAPEHAARAFEPFFTTRADGTGLGLAVVRGIASAHRGEVTVESAVGVGTTARVRIPAAPENGVRHQGMEDGVARHGVGAAV